MTAKLNLIRPTEGPIGGSKVVISRSTGMIVDEKKEWFHDPSGVRGVIGIISGDFMTNYEQNRMRYLSSHFRYEALLSISQQSEEELRKEKIHARRDFDIQDTKKWIKATIPKGIEPRGRGLTPEPHLPPSLLASLILTDTFHPHPIVISFHPSPMIHLQKYVQSRYRETKEQIAACRERLEEIIEKCKGNMGLYSLVDNQRRNKEESRNQQNQSRERKRETEQRIPIVEEVNLFGPNLNLIGSRPVAEMKLPIQAMKEDKRSKILHHPDPWFRKPVILPRVVPPKMERNRNSGAAIL